MDVRMENCKTALKDLIIQELGDGYEVKSYEVSKNNGVIWNAVIISEKNSKKDTQPIIYIDEWIKGIIEEDVSLQEAAKSIISVYRERNSYMLNREDYNKETILQNVLYRAINRDMNKDLLKHVPHKDILDISAIYIWVISRDEEGRMFCKITNDDMENLNISFEELDEAARKNTELSGIVVAPLSEFMKQESMYDEDQCDEDSNELESLPHTLYILTTKTGIDGASVILYQSYIKSLADKLESDLYIIPASIHEILALPDSFIENEDDLREVTAMITDANETVVHPDEVLSGFLYKYTRESDTMEIVMLDEKIICV